MYKNMVLSYFVSMGSKISGKYLHLVNLSPPSVYEYNKQCKQREMYTEQI